MVSDHAVGSFSIAAARLCGEAVRFDALCRGATAVRFDVGDVVPAWHLRGEIVRVAVQATRSRGGTAARTCNRCREGIYSRAFSFVCGCRCRLRVERRRL